MNLNVTEQVQFFYFVLTPCQWVTVNHSPSIILQKKLLTTANTKSPHFKLTFHFCLILSRQKSILRTLHSANTNRHNRPSKHSTDSYDVFSFVPSPLLSSNPSDAAWEWSWEVGGREDFSGDKHKVPGAASGLNTQVCERWRVCTRTWLQHCWLWCSWSPTSVREVRCFLWHSFSDSSKENATS